MITACFDITIGGTVQGVGFRPFVYRTALDLHIAGHVSNTVRGVRIHAVGVRDILCEFRDRLRRDAPPLSRISSFECCESSADSIPADFRIVPSELGENPQVDITQDTAVCGNCLHEMRDPSNRRFGHPFITCTDCGPRFTIITGLPYDRPLTTMSGFPMCAACRVEYENPADRRFHAQPIACPDCGPKLMLLDSQGKPVPDDDPIRTTAGMLAGGMIVAIKGLGGFHLACRADSQEAVSSLRLRKHRMEKPLAIMTATVEDAARYAHITDTGGRLLQSPQRPIVLLDKKHECPGISGMVAPRVPTLGIMLPYTPIHHLLFDTSEYGALVMTSANITDEPICCGNEEAVGRLNGIADAFLIHDRPIHVRIDDSVARELGEGAVLMRRARGYVPSPIGAGADVSGIAALGGIMKSTVAVGRGSMCYVSHYLGAADSIETIDSCAQVLGHFTGMLGVEPSLYACDLHPAGLAAETLVPHGKTLIKIQHHHAHAAACMAEHGLFAKTICVVFDGMGLGDDGTIWGGEILVADRKSYVRAGHLAPMPMPGGDNATKYPGRMGIGALFGTQGARAPRFFPWIDETERQAVLSILEADVNCPRTSSMGRLFDAASALLDICRKQTYEGQPAIELEGAADIDENGSYPFLVRKTGGNHIMDGAEVLRSAAQDRDTGTLRGTVAARFHNTIAAMTAETVKHISDTTGITTVCLSGGCFQNRLLWQRTVDRIRALGLTPLWHRVLPPGDESISFGQIIIAAAQRSDDTDRGKNERK